jgi:8-oxo-dGTP pyrophosphatase MutT (NUDIX family)
MSGQKYNIFFNEHLLIIGSGNRSIHLPGTAIAFNPKQIDQCLEQLFNTKLKSAQFFIKTRFPKKTFREFKKLFTPIRAAGGVVFNEQGQLLIIKRMGKWDLPKGKLEKGEKLKIAALREVYEECGIPFLALEKKHTDTYHLYKHKQQVVLKHTVWYEMTAWNSVKPKPQLDEQIVEAKWIHLNEIPSLLDNTYSSLKPIFKGIYERKLP